VRILFISPRQCWPTRSGARLREYHFVRALALRGDLTYLYFADPADAPMTKDDLPFCRDIVGIPKPDSYGTAKLIQGLIGRWPLPILNYTSPRMSAAVERLASAARFDLIHLDSIHMIRYGQLPPLHGARIVYNWHNIESEAMRRFGATVPSLPRRWYAGQTAAKLAALEQGMLRDAFGHVVCSAREKDELHRSAPAARIRVVENGVDTRYFAAAEESTTPAQQIVFVGTMDYYPNVEAATSFATRIWPRVRERLREKSGQMSLMIVGANPTPAVLALGAMPGVTVTGTVPDVRPYYRDALAAIVPLRTGGGTRLKILEAMAAGVPVISTVLGAEGLAVTPGRDILIAGADDAQPWIDHLIALAQIPTRADQIRAALDLVRTRYDWEIVGQTLNDTYAAWLREAA
jgi:polysaccharide biosynthesis protein PslH